MTVAADFRQLVPLVLMKALRDAGTTVQEPVNRFELELPGGSVSPVLAKLAEAAATVEETVVGPQQQARLVGLIPAGRQHAFETQLPGLTHGEGVLLTSFEGFHPVAGVQPCRRTT
jgi:ribosomal protection tetracycline resistance protein